MKTRRHHNNKGSRQVKRGKTADQLKAIAKRLKLPFKTGQKLLNSRFSAIKATVHY